MPATPHHVISGKQLINAVFSKLDLIFVILDARAPNSTFNSFFMKDFGNAKKIFILTKTDLADDKETKKWIEYFNRMEESDCLGVSIKNNIYKTLFLSFFNKKYKGTKTIYSGVIGVPNTGKSSIIQYLSRSKKIKKADFPGVTKVLQWFAVTKNLKILDTPGVYSEDLNNKENEIILKCINNLAFSENDLEEMSMFLFQKMKAEQPKCLLSLGDPKLSFNDYFKTLHKKWGFDKQDCDDFSLSYRRFVKKFATGKLCKLTLNNCE